VCIEIRVLGVHSNEKPIYVFLEKELHGLGPNFHIHVSVGVLYIPGIGMTILRHEICGLILGIYKSLTDT
jgi:hypothetical protein